MTGKPHATHVRRKCPCRPRGLKADANATENLRKVPLQLSTKLERLVEWRSSHTSQRASGSRLYFYDAVLSFASSERLRARSAVFKWATSMLLSLTEPTEVQFRWKHTSRFSCANDEFNCQETELLRNALKHCGKRGTYKPRCFHSI